MYEMEGPQPGCTAPGCRSLDRLALPGLPPVAGTRAKRWFPGPSASPGSPPGPGIRLR